MSVRSYLGLTLTALVLVACGADKVVGSTTVATAVSHSKSTTTVDPESTSPTTTMTDPGELSTTTVDLLDGSGVELTGLPELQLTGYAFTMEVPGIRSSNVDLSRNADPTDAASVDEAAVLESNLGEGVRLWRADREGQPFYMTLDLGKWGAFLHVGNDSAPDTELLLSLADQLKGEASGNGVVLTNYQPDFFTTYLSDPATKNLIHLAANPCIRETGPGFDVVQDPAHGEVIRGPEYASWCDEDADIEVMVFGNEELIEQVLDGMTLSRSQPQDS